MTVHHHTGSCHCGAVKFEVANGAALSVVEAS